MFCRNCGKEIADDAVFCTFCGTRVEAEAPVKLDTPPAEEVFELKEDAVTAASETDFVSETAAPSQNDEEARSYGKGGAITALVLGITSFVLFYISMFACISGPLVFGLFFLVPSIVLGIIAVVKGAKSIGAFKEMGKQGRPRPVATLVMGIIGLALGALALFLDMIFFFTTCVVAVALL